MSVLARDPSSNNHYVFVKGAPEKIHLLALNKPKDFERRVEELSLGGFRTLAVAYKEVKEDVNLYLGDNRDIYQRDIHLIGLFVFDNKVKEEAGALIKKLNSSISTKSFT